VRSGFGLGLSCGLRGIGRCVTTPALWPWALVPAALAFALFVMPWWLAHDAVEARLRAWAEEQAGAGWGSAASWTATFVLFLAALVALYLVFAPLARVVAAPFLALLSDRTARALAGAEPPPLATHPFARFVFVPVRDALVFLAVRVVVTALLLPLHCVPFGSLVFFALLVPLEGLDRMDVAMSSRGVPLGRRLAFLGEQTGACIGLGVVAAALILVPVANVLLLPGLAVGAVLLDRAVTGADGTPSAEAVPA
jgi:CysZ protein